MRRHSALLIWTITAAAMPAPAALASGTAETPAFHAALQQPAGSDMDLLVAGSEVRTAPPRMPALSAGTYGPAARFQVDDSRFDSATRGATATAINFSSVVGADHTGWHLSWRLGPMRGLTPLDREGGSKMRFGGRLPGQPRIPGAGIFNVGVHYAFD